MNLKRNPEKVLAALQDLPNGRVIAKKKLTITFPVRFRDINLAVIGKVSFVYGLFAILVDDEYALLNLNGYIELGEAAIKIEQVGEVEYYTFTYDPGETVILTKDIIARSSLIFTAIDEFVFKGKVPWYVGYEDMGKIFETAQSYAGSRARIIPSMMEFFAAYTARQKEDRVRFIREGAKTRSDFTPDKIRWVPLRSVFYSAPGTVNKLAGAYFQDGIVSALVNPSTQVESVESVLRA